MGQVVVVTSSAELVRRSQDAMPGGHSAIGYMWHDHYADLEPVKLVHSLVEAGYDLVCLGEGVPPEYMLALAEAFDRLHPEVPVLMLARPTQKLVERALRAGVREILPAGAGTDVLAASVARALDAAARRRANLAGDTGVQPAQGRVVSVISPKGGSGKTMLATNLAVGLAASRPRKVAAVDLDAQFGDLASALALDPQHGLGDAAASEVPLDSTMMKVFLTPHASGLYALCGPDSPAQGDEVTYEHAGRVLQLLGEAFAFVIVDTAAGLDENTLVAIERSTDLLMVCTMDVSSVRGLRKEVDALDRLGMTTQQRHFVLNRFDARVGLEVADVEAAVGMKAAVTVPSSRLVPISMNRGAPVLDAEPRTPVAGALRRMVEIFAPASEPAETDAARTPRRWGRRRR
jgi:pilus assembly protein CpaE